MLKEGARFSAAPKRETMDYSLLRTDVVIIEDSEGGVNAANAAAHEN